ncbi:protein O-linked-mannose beta-1,4-N-acetylglucosaminyltransferase 2-like isoform X1 [Asterias rubens]|uniref:protein O-linked-mannose beta-1,4-N-acetylglucosaminyltransferase 2-like isoform X1 n=1 Tax=Asterias rubens TaxID=7604 RepID=UPI001455757A|nr:protein O-linked-mannose beta-1,4-N-acetylglucosaminyltransferase 2-like isoform X1 [Asterias rubens]
MTFSDTLTVLAVFVAAWGVYRCFILEEKLSNCSAKTASETPSFREKTDPETVQQTVLEGGSSVWCVGSSNTNRMCRFHNLCFSPKHKEFVFLEGPRSISYGLPRNLFDPALVDLSSVPNHNIQYFHYSSLPVSALERFKEVKLFSGKHVLMNRFKPNNVMHVFHDDLLPVFHTMLQAGLMNKTDFAPAAQLVFLDGFPEGDFMDLVKVLFHQQPLLKGDLVEGLDQSLVCFEEAHVGLSNVTVWYQYGFQVPQGPIPESLLSATKVKLFTHFVHDRIGFKGCEAVDSYAVLITRRSTRLILNEIELVSEIVKRTGMRVITAGLEDFPVTHLIEIISCAKALIGMHGSLLILAMFLPPGSILLELFPYAINPAHYTPYRRLVELQGMGIVYRCRRNLNPSHAVAHPDALPAYGGIHHLSLEEQKQIIESTEVPQHLCCSNPEWLFRIYQDTIVNIPSLLEALASWLGESEQTRKVTKTFNLFPSEIQNFICDRENGLHISWDQPWNIEYMNTHEVKHEVKYEVWIQQLHRDDYEAYIMQFTDHVFTEGIEETEKYRIWVRCLVGDIQGPFTDVVC